MHVSSFINVKKKKSSGEMSEIFEVSNMSTAMLIPMPIGTNKN